MIAIFVIAVGWLLIVVATGGLLLGIVAMAQHEEPEGAGMLILAAGFLLFIGVALISF